MEVHEYTSGSLIGGKYYVVPTALFICPPLILFIFFVMLFEEELKDVSIRSLFRVLLFKVKRFFGK
jgi:hypothetical protein